jgi:inositol phosphorylceramide mannosyltransferase catalytic subunit
MWKLICIILICCVFILGVIKFIRMIKNKKQKDTYSIVLYGVSLLTIIALCLLIVFQNSNHYLESYKESVKLIQIDPYKETINPKMPRVIHRTYRTFPEAMKLFKKSWMDTKKKLPDWEQKFYSDSDIENWLLSTFGINSVITKAYHSINPKFGAARADLFRYLVIYIHGGLYLDLKSFALKELPILSKNTEMLISPWGTPQWSEILGKSGEIQNWYLYALPGAKALELVIKRIVNNIYSIQMDPINAKCLQIIKDVKEVPTPKDIVLTTTGPIAYTLALQNFDRPSLEIVKPNLNNCLAYAPVDKWTEHEKLQGKNHYSKQTGSLILLNGPKISQLEIDNISNELRSARARVHN